ncbi:MAG TPA: hypothetical protein VHP80_10010, partial [Candidatus Acidoferrum sp.]|nr:hypothetical protein [Candidatus Acidoferrum sp.]
IKVTFLGDAPKPTDAKTAQVAALVPQSAIHDDAGKEVVFLVKDAKLERRAVTLGENRGSDTEIMGGLVAGDAVVVAGPTDLRDGQSVAIKK